MFGFRGHKVQTHALKLYLVSAVTKSTLELNSFLAKINCIQFSVNICSKLYLDYIPKCWCAFVWLIEFIWSLLSCNYCKSKGFQSVQNGSTYSKIGRILKTFAAWPWIRMTRNCVKFSLFWIVVFRYQLNNVFHLSKISEWVRKLLKNLNSVWLRISRGIRYSLAR